jgi:hypothetical protein
MREMEAIALAVQGLAGLKAFNVAKVPEVVARLDADHDGRVLLVTTSRDVPALGRSDSSLSVSHENYSPFPSFALTLRLLAFWVR